VTDEPQPPGQSLEGPHRSAVFAGLGGTALVLGLCLAIGGTPPVAQKLSEAAGAVQPGRAYSFLEELQQRYPRRTFGSEAQRGAVAFIADRFRRLGVADVRSETLGSPRHLTNIIARIPGRDRSREVVLNAHHDVVPGAPGAIDDGGGVATLIEAAAVLAARAEPPACDVVFAVFDGEEHDCLGAKAHLRALGKDGRARVGAALAVELVGWKQDKLVVHTLPYGFAWDAEGIAPAWIPSAVRGAGAAAGLDVGLGDPVVSVWYQGTVRLFKIETGSDAGAYSEQGIPACMLTGSALTNFYTGYHRSTDSMDRVSSERLDDAARVVVVTALEFAARAVLKDGSSTTELGESYLMLGRRLLGPAALALLGLCAAGVVLIAAAGWRRLGKTSLAVLLAGTGVAMAGVAAVGSVTGWVIGMPICLGLAFAGCVTRRGPVTVIAFLPFYVQLALLAGAAKSFGGLGWRGTPQEAFFLLALTIGAVGSGFLVRRV
jgi:hypothetical protein